MRVAIPFEDDRVFQHFGKSSKFKIYDISNLEVVNTQIIDVDNKGHEAISSLLNDLGVHLVICGGIGEGAINTLNTQKITICSGLDTKCDEAIEAFLSGQLFTMEKVSAEATCSVIHEVSHECCDKHSDNCDCGDKDGCGCCR